MVSTTQSRVIPSLRQTQANAVMMYLNNKRYHWLCFGPHFRDIHLFFDEMALAAFNEIDPFAERVRMLGGDPVSTPQEIHTTASIRPAEGQMTPHEMLREALDNERTIIREMRDAAREADQENDFGTNDLYSKSVQAHEKNAWFIDEFLRRDDGFAS